MRRIIVVLLPLVKLPLPPTSVLVLLILLQNRRDVRGWIEFWMMLTVMLLLLLPLLIININLRRRHGMSLVFPMLLMLLRRWGGRWRQIMPMRPLLTVLPIR